MSYSVYCAGSRLLQDEEATQRFAVRSHEYLMFLYLFLFRNFSSCISSEMLVNKAQ